MLKDILCYERSKLRFLANLVMLECDVYCIIKIIFPLFEMKSLMAYYVEVLICVFSMWYIRLGQNVHESHGQYVTEFFF